MRHELYNEINHGEVTRDVLVAVDRWSRASPMISLAGIACVPLDGGPGGWADLAAWRGIRACSQPSAGNHPWNVHVACQAGDLWRVGMVAFVPSVWLLRYEWWIGSRVSGRRISAWRKAGSGSLRVIVSLIAKPTTRREKRSRIAAR